MESSLFRRLIFATLLSAGFIAGLMTPALAQGGPPLITNDPGTPGSKNWEINLGFMPILTNHANQLQVPQIDLNYGLGNRIQLTYEVPFVWQSSDGQPNATGWSNAFPGIKWRFLDRGEDGWQISTFPQIEVGGSPKSVKSGLAEGGTRLLTPFEFSHPLGPIHLDFEAGYYFPLHSPQAHDERILGLALGHSFSEEFEGIGEVYDDRVMGASPHETTFDLGGRYKFHKGLLLLFMAGRSFSGNSSAQPEFLGYVGLQILLEKYGRRLQSER